MQNLISHQGSSLDWKLSKKKGIYVKKKSKNSSFYDTYPQIYIKKVLNTYTVFQI